MLTIRDELKRAEKALEAEMQADEGGTDASAPVSVSEDRRRGRRGKAKDEL
jgi:hypothetical protein